LVTLTLAFGTAAPEGSVTVPFKDAPPTADCPNEAVQNASAHIDTFSIVFPIIGRFLPLLRLQASVPQPDFNAMKAQG
jgi:hypothetical protein